MKKIAKYLKEKFISSQISWVNGSIVGVSWGFVMGTTELDLMRFLIATAVLASMIFIVTTVVVIVCNVTIDGCRAVLKVLSEKK